MQWQVMQRGCCVGRAAVRNVVFSWCCFAVQLSLPPLVCYYLLLCILALACPLTHIVIGVPLIIHRRVTKSTYFMALVFNIYIRTSPYIIGILQCTLAETQPSGYSDILMWFYHFQEQLCSFGVLLSLEGLCPLLIHLQVCLWAELPTLNAGKNSALSLPTLDWLARCASWNVTPSGKQRLNCRSNFYQICQA